MDLNKDLSIQNTPIQKKFDFVKISYFDHSYKITLKGTFICFKLACL